MFIARGVSKHIELIPRALRQGTTQIPRYVRVNTLNTTVDAVIARFRDGLIVAHRDALIDSLLILSSGTDLHAHPLLLAGDIVLQDKASCLSAFALQPRPGMTVIDACAAPGNKTSHLLAIAHDNRSKEHKNAHSLFTLHAYEVHPRRYDLLTSQLKKLRIPGSADCCDYRLQTHNASFLDVPPSTYVNAILLDPTCSGSGMRCTLEQYYKQRSRRIGAQQNKAQLKAHVRQQRKTLPSDQRTKFVSTPSTVTTQYDESDTSADVEEEARDESTIKSLAAFQVRILVHALSFPSCDVVVYSTCSLHQAENEDVVAAALRLRGGEWDVTECIPQWPRRGLTVDGLTAQQSRALVRVDSALDEMNGFFVAKFIRQRKNDSEQEATTTVTSAAVAVPTTVSSSSSPATSLPKRLITRMPSTRDSPTDNRGKKRRRMQ